MCNHSMIQSFGGQDFCVSCGEEMNTNTGLSLSLDDNRTDEDDDSSEAFDWVEREENNYLNSFGE